MKKVFSLMLTALMMTSVLAGCGGSGEGGAAGKELKFTTGSSSGTYYAFGTLLAGQVTKNSESKVTAVEGKGSQGNIELMQIGGADLGFVQSDVMSYAYEGTNTFAEKGKVENFSTVAALYTEQVQIVTCDPTIKTVADLAGKNVSIGEAGSGVYFNAVDVLGAYDLDVKADINAKYLGFAESADALKDGKIDAAFLTSGIPTTAVTELAAAKDVYLVSLDDEHADALIEKSPYYVKTTIPADTYKMDADATTVSVGAVVVARDDVPEEDVYNFVSSVFAGKDELAANHPKGAELDMEYASSITSVPYHPGAAKYFAENEFTVPVK